MYDSTLTGNNRWGQDLYAYNGGGMPGPGDGVLDIEQNIFWNDDGITTPGYANVAFNNTISNFGDSFAFSVNYATPSVGVHFYRNDVRNSGDDLLEADYGTRNLSFYDNRSHNSMTFLSLDPIYGGPFVFARNIGINPARTPYKWNSDNSGQFILNNTVVRTARAAGGTDPSGWYQPNNGAQRAYGYQNNILIYRGAGTYTPWLESSIHNPIDWTNNSWYPDKGIQWGGTWNNLASAQAGIPNTTPVFSGATKRLQSDNITTSDPFVTSIPLGANGRTEVVGTYTPTLQNNSSPKNSGTAIPNINDGFSGGAPDRGAIISGIINPVWGDRGTTPAPTPVPPPPLPVPATVTMSGPSNGTINNPSSNFTVSVAGTINGTVTFTQNDGGRRGTFTPSSVSVSQSSPSKTFTYTASSAGSSLVAVSNNGGLVNPLPITFTASAPAQVQANIVQYITHDGDMVGNVDNTSAPNRAMWNTVLSFPWKRGGMGDWMDAQQRPFGLTTDGAVPYASFAVPAPGTYTANVTSLVTRWKSNGQNRGFYLRQKNNAFPISFAGRTDPNPAIRPKLTVTTTDGIFTLSARANATWVPSSYGSISSSLSWKLSVGQPAIVQFDLSSVTGTVTNATLQVTDTFHAVGSTMALGVVDIFEADPPTFVVPNVVTNPTLGLAATVPNFQSLATNPDVLFSDDFATPGPFDTGWSRTPERILNPETNTTFARGDFATGQNGSTNNKRLVMRGANGEGGQGMDVQRDELYSQYYLYLDTDFGSNISWTKLPAMAGQFGYWKTNAGGYWQMVTGNGGSPGTGLKVYNSTARHWEYEGHSTRLFTGLRAADNSAYSELFSIGPYIYNLDQGGNFGSSYNNFEYTALQRGKWYAIDLYMKQNSMSGTRDANGNYSIANPDGVYSAWINGYPVFNKTDLRWRKNPEFGVEGFWLDFYHGGIPPAPYPYHYGVDRVTIAKKYIGPQTASSTPPILPPPTSVPTVTLTASQNSIAYNSVTAISWSSTNATSCVTPWGATTTSGNYITPMLTVTTNYSVTCTGVGGSKTSSILITVAPNPSPIPPNPDPTLPSWVPAPGRVAVLTQSNGRLTNTFISRAATYYYPYYSAKIVNDFSTSVFNPYLGDYGSILFFGGGHAGTNDNSVMALVLGKDTSTFRRMTNPSPIFGSDSSNATRGANSVTSSSSFVNQEYCENIVDGQPVAAHTYGSGDVIGPESGGATYGTFIEVVCSSGSYAGTANGEVAHKIDFNTTNGHADGGTATYVWQRIAKKANAPVGPEANSTLGAPVWSAYVPAQHRVYYESRAMTRTRPVRWFDTVTNTYVEGTGIGRTNDSDSPDNGNMFYVPERNLIVMNDLYQGKLRIRYMDVSVAQPSWSQAVTLSQQLAIPDSWSAALWYPDGARILVGNVTNDDNAIYEINIPTNLSNEIWAVERAPLASGDTITWAPSTTYKKWVYNPKIKAVIYMPYANPNGGDDTVFVYRPRSSISVASLSASPTLQIATVNVTSINSTVQSSSQVSLQPLQALKSTSFSRVLSRGMQGNDVYLLQTYLAEDPSLFTSTPNGLFGPITEIAVKRFQLKNKVVSSPSDPGYGFFGKKTQAKFITVFGNTQ
jgi:hypothetical protein